MLFHEQFWMILTNYSQDQVVSVEILYAILRIIMDPIALPIEKTTQIMKNFLLKHFPDCEEALDHASNAAEFTIKPWKLELFIQ